MSDKTAIVIRHAESEFNYELDGDNDKRFDEKMKKLVDCGITEKGIQKCKEMTGTVTADIVVISPLRRAIETAMLIFPGIVTGDVPHVIQPLAAEHLLDTCDIGSDREQLKNRFPWINTSLLTTDRWWYSGKDLNDIWKDMQSPPFEPEEHFESRVSKLRQYLTTLTDDKIVVVAHSNVIFCLTQYEKEGEIFGQWVDNNACVEIPL